MTTSYPAALDSFTRPAATDQLSSATVPHAAAHDNAYDAIEAIEAFLGITGAEFPGGVKVTGGPDFASGQVRLGPSSASPSVGVTTQGTGTPDLYFDHRGTGNAGRWYWRNGTGGGTTVMALSGTGLLTIPGTPAFVASVKYLVIDASGNVHKSALGPAS